MTTRTVWRPASQPKSRIYPSVFTVRSLGPSKVRGQEIPRFSVNLTINNSNDKISQMLWLYDCSEGVKQLCGGRSREKFCRSRSRSIFYLVGNCPLTLTRFTRVRIRKFQDNGKSSKDASKLSRYYYKRSPDEILRKNRQKKPSNLLVSRVLLSTRWKYLIRFYQIFT